jgi:hypothetical protein
MCGDRFCAVVWAIMGLVDDLVDDPEDSGPTRGRADQWLTDYNERVERLKDAVASGPVATIPLTGAAQPPDPAGLQPVDPLLLAEMLGRKPTIAELAVAPAMLADAMAWAADPTRHRRFLEAELQAWTAAYAGMDADANPYAPDHPDKDLRSVRVGAYFRALAAKARPGTPHRRSRCPGRSASGPPAAVSPMAR